MIASSTFGHRQFSCWSKLNVVMTGQLETLSQLAVSKSQQLGQGFPPYLGSGLLQDLYLIFLAASVLLLQVLVQLE